MPVMDPLPFYWPPPSPPPSPSTGVPDVPLPEPRFLTIPPRVPPTVVGIGPYSVLLQVLRHCLSALSDRLDQKRRAEIDADGRSEEHTSELQSRLHLVC